MIELVITPTMKSYAPSAAWHRYPNERHAFEDRAAAEAWIAQRYGKAKRRPIYRDRKAGPPIKVGCVIGYRNADLSHAPVQRWLQQDWIEFRECKPLDLGAR